MKTLKEAACEQLSQMINEAKWPEHLLSQGNDKDQWLVLLRAEDGQPWEVRIYWGKNMDDTLYKAVKDMKVWETRKVWVENGREALAIKI